MTIKVTASMRRMVFDTDYFKLVSDYVRAVDAIRQFEAMNRAARRPTSEAEYDAVHLPNYIKSLRKD
jgi:hypothetical protein